MFDPQSAARKTHLCPSQPHYGLHPAIFSGNNPVTSSGCLQLLEIYWNLKTLLEISWNLIGPPGNFCVRCWRSTALASSHKAGYQIAYLRNWSWPYFIFATTPCCIKCISYFCFISRKTTLVHYIAGRSKANMSCFFLKSLLESPGNLLD